MAKPIAGYGTQGLIQGYWHNYTSSLNVGLEWNDNAHSIIFNLLGDLGLIGFLVFAGIIFLSVKTILKKEKKRKRETFGLVFYSLPLVIHSFSLTMWTLVF